VDERDEELTQTTSAEDGPTGAGATEAPPASGEEAPADGAQHEPAGENPTDVGEEVDEEDTPLAADEDALAEAADEASLGAGADRLHTAMGIAANMGLVITSTTGPGHTTGSYHYRQPYRTVVIKNRRYQLGRAADIAKAGNPSALYREYFHRIEKMKPAELFYDPMGYSWKNGRKVDWTVGNHRDHVHVAF
jgi:hypothetical protein